MSLFSVGHLGLGALGGAVRGEVLRGAVAGCEPGPCVRSGSGGPAVALASLATADAVVEAAGVDAARAWLPSLVDRGVDVVLCSCAVLADDAFADRVLGGSGRGRVIVPAGAIGGLDLLGAAARASDPLATRVRLRTTKTPTALGVAVDRPTTVFRGSARQAGLAFPRTANVAVTLGLATTGLDQVEVEVVADPAVVRTEHLVSMRSDVGDYEISVANAVDPMSAGRTSRVTAWSVVITLEAIAAGHGAGVLVDR
ncbi:aspartate dehydrogenase domain-containing protein [Jatrophihabitans sp. YIM 134969]